MDPAETDGNAGIYEDDAERARAVRYSRTREWLVLADTASDALTNAVLLFTGLSALLRRLSGRATKRVGPAGPYTVLLSLLTFITSLPLSYISGYVVEKRYGLSNQTRLGWLGDQLKGLGVGIVIGAPLAHGAHAIIRRWPRWWWAMLAGLTVPLSVIMANLAPVLLMPLFNKFRPLRDSALAERIKSLAEGQGVSVSDVLEMDMSRQTKKANAMFTGLGNTKRIILGDTLIEGFTSDEVEVVIAHELGHQVHRDIWKFIALSAPASAIALFSAHTLSAPLLRRFGHRWGLNPDDGAADPAALPALMLAGQVGLMALMPTLNAISRRFVEHPADRYALELTGKSDAFIGAMQKLARMNLANPSPSRLVKYLLYSHPPMSERIAYAHSFDSKGQE